MRHQLPAYSPVTWRGIARGVGRLATGDPQGRLDERARELLRERYDAKEVLLTDSGTSALRLAISGALRDVGGPVALPAYGCFDLASAAEGAGARVRLYDVDPDSLGPACGSLETICSRGIGAVVVAYLFGYPIDLEPLGALPGEPLIIEDAAQGAGGSRGGRPLGSFGSLSILSFGRGKGLTSGGGGALLAHDSRGVAVLQAVKDQVPMGAGGRGVQKMIALAGQHLLGRPSLYSIPASLPFLHLGETRYHPPRPPKGPTAASLAVLESALFLGEREARARRRNATRLLDALVGASLLRPLPPVWGEAGFLRLPAMVVDEATTDPLLEGGRRLGVARGYPRSLSALPSLDGYLDDSPVSAPGAERLARTLITLPTHGLLSERDLAGVEKWAFGWS